MLNRYKKNQISLFEGVDSVAVIIYLLLVAVGFVNIISASYNDEIEVFRLRKTI